MMTTLTGLLLAFGSVAAADEEPQLISVLQSDKSPAEKDAACQRLKHIGTGKSAAALGALLADEALSMSARVVLEGLPGPEASKALREAVAKTTGLTRVGIIDSIGIRRDEDAVGLLTPLLTDADASVASSAAVALGRIGGDQAVAALRASREKAAPAVRPAVDDGLLRAAEGLSQLADQTSRDLLVRKYRQQAEGLYRELYDSQTSEHVRTAACRGWLLAGQEQAPARILEAMGKDDQSARLAAVQLVRDLPGEAATKAFVEYLQAGKLPPVVLAGVVEALTQRGDRLAAPAIAEAAGAKNDMVVRLSAVRALASMGDASAVAPLAKAAAEKDDALRDAARYSLSVVKAPGVLEAIVEQLGKAEPAVQVELVRAIGVRREPGAAAGLVKLARDGEASIRGTAIQALGQIGDDAAAGQLVLILAGEIERDLADATELAVAAIAGRSAQRAALAEAALGRMGQADLPARCRLLRVAGRIGGDKALAALRQAVKASEAELADAAVRTLGDHGPLEAAGDLLALARTSENPAHRILALRGYCRLIGQASARPAAQRLEMCRNALTAATRVEEKRLALAQLATIDSAAAMKLAEEQAAQAELRSEAEQACAKIATALAGADPAVARAALTRLAKTAADASVRQEAARVLEAMDQYQGYVALWSYAGPYQQAGKECQALFDVAFAPEKPDGKVQWKPLPGAAWQADLLGAVGGHQAVIYVRSRVIVPKAAKVRLDMGSDDGLKVWLNGKLVHANNTMRAVAPMQDKAQAELKEGPNDLLIKVTQNVMGCAVCVRFRNADGSVIDGLRFERP